MSKNIFRFLISLFICVFLFYAKDASALTKFSGSIDVPTILKKENSPYISRGITVNAPLTIEPGVVIKFDYDPRFKPLFEVKGELKAIGTKDEPIIFTSSRDDSFGGDTNGDGNNSFPAPGEWDSLTFRTGSKGILDHVSVLYGVKPLTVYGAITLINVDDVVIKNSEIKYSGYIGIYLCNSSPVIENNIISNNNTGIAVQGKKKVVVSNNIIANNNGGVSIFGIPIYPYQIDARNNWWGDASGPYYKRGYYGGGEDENLDGKGNSVNYGVMFRPWLQKDPTIEDESCQENCYSNVLFLPGIKASHLYKYDADNDLDELWVPNWFGNDIEELKLDSDGKSIEKVFTKDGAVLQETALGNLYKSFLADLNQLKADNVINDYKAFAYDWRQSVEDIAKNGTPYENNEIKSIVNEVNNLAQNSKSGKVTIIAHSNGGLVAKAVMKELEGLGLVDNIDKIILVASPQMGTPLAALSFLYGYEESLPTLLSQSQARSLIENMPGAYGLLPSNEYLKRQSEAGDALINFSSENSERGKMFGDAYGDKIDSLSEFREFLLAIKDKREKPKSSEIDLENILNEKLLNEAISIHEKLDNWVPPENIEVIQLAGWGLPTVSGIDYVEKKNVSCLQRELSALPVCAEEEGKYELIYEPKFTADGDAIVATPSALTMVKSGNVDRYWFDAKRYNDKQKENKEHSNILEVSNIRDFIKDEIQNNEIDLLEYIGIEKPADFENMKPRIKMSLYSPLDIHLYDSNGNHTGYKEIQTSEGPRRIIEENIPNSYYMQLGDRKYVGFPEGEDVEIKLDGYGEGAYTLKIEEVKDTESGEEIINHITFKNLPASENTQTELIIPASGLENISNLEADYDGDGDNDYVLESILGEEITMPDITPPVIEIASPENRRYNKNETLSVSYEVSDDRSEEIKIKIEVLLDNEIITEDNIDLSLLKTGEHKLVIKAVDEADNPSKKEVIFDIFTDIKILKDNFNHFYDLELIKSEQEKNMIINNLSVLEKEIEFYDIIKNDISPKVENVKKRIQTHIDTVEKKIGDDKKNYVTMIKEIIMSDLEFIKNKY